MLDDITLEPQTTRTCALSGDTKIIDEDGNTLFLEELAGEYTPPQIMVLSVNRQGQVKRVSATDFKIVDWENEIVSITLDNGHRITSTKDQLFLKASGEWIRAEEISFQTVLSTILYDPSHPYPTQSFQEVTHVHKKKLNYRLPFYSFTVKNTTNLLIAEPLTSLGLPQTQLYSLVPAYGND